MGLRICSWHDLAGAGWQDSAPLAPLLNATDADLSAFRAPRQS